MYMLKVVNLYPAHGVEVALKESAGDYTSLLARVSCNGTRQAAVFCDVNK